ncbi:MAG: sugar transferase [Candidatus Avispirillum sp.]
MDVKTTVRDPGVQEYTPVRKSGVYRALKRAADIVLSLLAIIILALPLLIVYLAVIIEDGAPAFYTQERVGKDRRKFKIYKFRSMHRNADKIHEQLRHEYGSSDVSFKLKDSEDPRITKVGRFIRRTNIDELPQLVNILKGEMSLVGPRPLATYEYDEEQSRYGDRYAARYDVPQGLTCYWQISSRSEVDFEDRMQMDVDYARDAKISVDTKLLFKTAVYAITGKAGYDGAGKKR